jgi:hypothetical protein
MTFTSISIKIIISTFVIVRTWICFRDNPNNPWHSFDAVFIGSTSIYINALAMGKFFFIYFHLYKLYLDVWFPTAC